MQLQNFYAQDVNGNIVPGAICSLFLPGTTTLATGLQDVNGLPLTNPFAANSDGLVQFAAPNGKYDLKIEAGLIVSTLPITFADTYQALIQLGGFLPPSATPPIVRADGTPLQLGDRYMKTPEDIEYIYKTSGWEANNLDGQLLAAPGGSDLVGNGIRTQADKNLDVISVRDYITTAIDGTTSNQAGIQDAVNAAIARGCGLFWPGYPADYVSDSDISGFHSVKHSGTGAWLKRGSSRYKIENDGENRNILYVDPAGSGDGISDAQPAAITSVFGYLKAKGPVLGGRWRIQLAAGTYPPVPAQITGFSAENYVEIFGPPVAYGTPTAIIDAANTAWCLYFTGGFSVWFKDVKGVNATDGSVAAAFICDNMNICFSDNVHTNNTQWAGVNANNCSRLIVYGGRYENSATSGLKGYGGTLLSIGRDGFRPQLVNCQTGVAAQGGAYGHVDYCDYFNCATGLEALFNVHVSNYNSTFTDCPVMSECDMTSTINNDGYATTNVPTLMRAVGSTSYFNRRYEDQFWPFSGVNGRSSHGYTAYTVPNTKYQYSKDGTTAGFNLSGLAPATALWESNGNTIISLAAPDASYSAIWAANSTSARHCEMRASTGTWSMLFNAASGYTFSAVRLAPGTDNDKPLGSASLRFSVVFAGTGTINTSDERLKKVRGILNEREMSAWGSVQAKVYQFTDMVGEKGEKEARLHIGYVAQEIQQAFIDHGLDPANYALWCEDEITKKETIKRTVSRQKFEVVTQSRVDIEVIDGVPVQKVVNEEVEVGAFDLIGVVDERGNQVVGEDGKQATHPMPIMEDVEIEEEIDVPDGTRFGLRYTECLVLQGAYLRTLIADQEKRILALEAK